MSSRRSSRHSSTAATKAALVAFFTVVSACEPKRSPPQPPLPANAGYEVKYEEFDGPHTVPSEVVRNAMTFFTTK